MGYRVRVLGLGLRYWDLEVPCLHYEEPVFGGNALLCGLGDHCGFLHTASRKSVPLAHYLPGETYCVNVLVFR